MIQKNLINFGPSELTMFGKEIVLMLLILIQSNIYMTLINILLLFGMQITSLIHETYITLITNRQNVNVAYSFLQRYV